MGGQLETAMAALYGKQTFIENKTTVDFLLELAVYALFNGPMGPMFARHAAKIDDMDIQRALTAVMTNVRRCVGHRFLEYDEHEAPVVSANKLKIEQLAAYQFVADQLSDEDRYEARKNTALEYECVSLYDDNTIWSRIIRSYILWGYTRSSSNHMLNTVYGLCVDHAASTSA